MVQPKVDTAELILDQCCVGWVSTLFVEKLASHFHNLVSSQFVLDSGPSQYSEKQWQLLGLRLRQCLFQPQSEAEGAQRAAGKETWKRKVCAGGGAVMGLL